MRFPAAFLSLTRLDPYPVVQGPCALCVSTITVFASTVRYPSSILLSTLLPRRVEQQYLSLTFLLLFRFLESPPRFLFLSPPAPFLSLLIQSTRFTGIFHRPRCAMGPFPHRHSRPVQNASRSDASVSCYITHVRLPRVTSTSGWMSARSRVRAGARAREGREGLCFIAGTRALWRVHFLAAKLLTSDY